MKRVKELTDGWARDVVMEVGGFPAITAEGVRMVASGGRYVEIGNISPGLTYQADPALWVTQNITVYGGTTTTRGGTCGRAGYPARARGAGIRTSGSSRTSFRWPRSTKCSPPRTKDTITRSSLVP